MNLRQEDLQNIAKTAGFRAEMLEKVIRLIELLNELFDNTFLKQRSIPLFQRGKVPPVCISVHF